ncbi:MAG TPA: M20/M25/M40 family metallo-hydrolase [Solirubrobacterales bacterium]|nr:M20/M25/M40 family metallo-hydrolase [Solirubrobacterales bacterium]
MDEKALTERLIRYDTSDDEGIRKAAGFVKGWLESRDIPIEELEIRGLPLLAASVGSDTGPTIVLHGHLDVVPAHAEQFEPRIEGDRILGRGAYDMKGALAAMMGALEELRNEQGVRVLLAIVPDEESEEEIDRGTAFLIQSGYTGDFAITGEPTDLHVGVQAKGVLAMRLVVDGTAAHGATPWLGDNAILKALDAFRAIESLPFARESSDLFDRPSINLGRILGGDALNKVPDSCVIDVDIRYLPGQDPAEIRAQVSDLPDVSVVSQFHREPAIVDRNNPFVRVLSESVAPVLDSETISVGRDGASDAICFIGAGVPAVEFGPVGGGHHGPEEWVSASSLGTYRRTLVDFVRRVPDQLTGDKPNLRIA